MLPRLQHVEPMGAGVLCLCVRVVAGGGDRDAVDDVLDVLALEAVHRRVFQGAERLAEADEVHLRHPHESSLERHPCINFLFYLKKFSLKINNKK